MFLTKSAKLTCRISNTTVDADYSKLNITWTRASDGKQLHTVVTNYQDQGNNFHYVDAVAMVPSTEWLVTFEGVLVKPVEKPVKKETDGKPNAPSLHILPPPAEELDLQEIRSLTCLIEGFYPNKFFVQWLQNGQPVNESAYYTGQPNLQSKTPKKYFSYSRLTISKQAWNAGDTFSCLVGHEAFPFQVIRKTVKKYMGKPSIVDVSLILFDSASPCY
ncbi:putative Ig mu chain C region protein [Naja naja]|nr:putative Ig mu chain C region protein [Naja naja]